MTLIKAAPVKHSQLNASAQRGPSFNPDAVGFQRCCCTEQQQRFRLEDAAVIHTEWCHG